MERVKLWRNQRKRLVGTVELDEGNRRLLFHIDDEAERDEITRIFTETGALTYSWTGYGDEWQENQAEPLTAEWFWFVVANILYPRGYQADFGAGD